MLTNFAAKLFGPRRAGLLFRLISENAWDHRRDYALALVLMALVAATSGAVALLVGSVLDDVFIQRRAGMVGVIAIWVLAIFLIRGASAYGQTMLLGRIGNRVVADLQSRIYDHILTQGMAFHAREGTGELTTRITHNCSAARQALDIVATRLGVDMFSVIVLVAVMLWQDLTMSLIALIGLPAVIGGVSALVRRVRKLSRDEVNLQAGSSPPCPIPSRVPASSRRFGLRTPCAHAWAWPSKECVYAPTGSSSCAAWSAR